MVPMLGMRIAALRHKAGLSQAALANRLNISPSAVGMYEKGRREPSIDMIIALAREFDVTTDYLLTGKWSSRQENTSTLSEAEELAALIISLLTKQNQPQL